MVKSRGYKADDLFELRTMADPQISPNGSLIACSVSEIDRALDAYRTSIWLYEDGAAARELTLSGGSNSQPRCPMRLWPCVPPPSAPAKPSWSPRPGPARWPVWPHARVRR